MAGSSRVQVTAKAHGKYGNLNKRQMFSAHGQAIIEQNVGAYVKKVLDEYLKKGVIGKVTLEVQGKVAEYFANMFSLLNVYYAERIKSVLLPWAFKGGRSGQKYGIYTGSLVSSIVADIQHSLNDLKFTGSVDGKGSSIKGSMSVIIQPGIRVEHSSILAGRKSSPAINSHEPISRYAIQYLKRNKLPAILDHSIFDSVQGWVSKFMTEVSLGLIRGDAPSRAIKVKAQLKAEILRLREQTRQKIEQAAINRLKEEEQKKKEEPDQKKKKKEEQKKKDKSAQKQAVKQQAQQMAMAEKRAEDFQKKTEEAKNARENQEQKNADQKNAQSQNQKGAQTTQAQATNAQATQAQANTQTTGTTGNSPYVLRSRGDGTHEILTDLDELKRRLDEKDSGVKHDSGVGYGSKANDPTQPAQNQQAQNQQAQNQQAQNQQAQNQPAQNQQAQNQQAQNQQAQNQQNIKQSAYPTSPNVRSAQELLTPEAQQQIAEVRKHYENPDGTMKDGYMKAPNGKDSNLPEYLWLLVHTPNFKAWFGDWEKDPKNASKILDANGEPRPVYHGTPLKDIEVFQRGTKGWLGPAIYVTPYKAYADSYIKGKPGETSDQAGTVMELFINIRNPLQVVTENPMMELLRSLYGDDAEVVFARRYQEVYDREAEPYKEQLAAGGQKAEEAKKLIDRVVKRYIISDDELQKILANGNYDGIAWHDPEEIAELKEQMSPEDFNRVGDYHTEYALQKPTQVKSASNDGTFGITTQNVYHQRAKPSANNGQEQKPSKELIKPNNESKTEKEPPKPVPEKAGADANGNPQRTNQYPRGERDQERYLSGVEASGNEMVGGPERERNVPVATRRLRRDEMVINGRLYRWSPTRHKYVLSPGQSSIRGYTKRAEGAYDRAGILDKTLGGTGDRPGTSGNNPDANFRSIVPEAGTKPDPNAPVPEETPPDAVPGTSSTADSPVNIYKEIKEGLQGTTNTNLNNEETADAAGTFLSAMLHGIAKSAGTSTSEILDILGGTPEIRDFTAEPYNDDREKARVREKLRKQKEAKKRAEERQKEAQDLNANSYNQTVSARFLRSIRGGSPELMAYKKDKMDKLAKAEQMLADGKSDAEIWFATGFQFLPAVWEWKTEFFVGESDLAKLKDFVETRKRLEQLKTANPQNFEALPEVQAIRKKIGYATDELERVVTDANGKLQPGADYDTYDLKLGAVKLPDVLQNQLLYELYPGLKQVVLTFEYDQDPDNIGYHTTIRGHWIQSTNRDIPDIPLIAINASHPFNWIPLSALIPTTDKLYGDDVMSPLYHHIPSVLEHESTHEVQTIEKRKFRGKAISEGYDTDIASIHPSLVFDSNGKTWIRIGRHLELNALRTARKIFELQLKSKPAIQQRFKELRVTEKVLGKAQVQSQLAGLTPAEQQMYKEWSQALDDAQYYQSQVGTNQEPAWNLFYVYHLASGEVDARVNQVRQTLTEAQRLALPLIHSIEARNQKGTVPYDYIKDVIHPEISRDLNIESYDFEAERLAAGLTTPDALAGTDIKDAFQDSQHGVGLQAIKTPDGRSLVHYNTDPNNQVKKVIKIDDGSSVQSKAYDPTQPNTPFRDDQTHQIYQNNQLPLKDLVTMWDQVAKKLNKNPEDVTAAEVSNEYPYEMAAWRPNIKIAVEAHKVPEAYQIPIPSFSTDTYLDWDKTLSDQTPAVQQKLHTFLKGTTIDASPEITGKELFERIAQQYAKDNSVDASKGRQMASAILAGTGLDGTTYKTRDAQGRTVQGYTIWTQDPQYLVPIQNAAQIKNQGPSDPQFHNIQEAQEAYNKAQPELAEVRKQLQPLFKDVIEVTPALATVDAGHPNNKPVVDLLKNKYKIDPAPYMLYPVTNLNGTPKQLEEARVTLQLAAETNALPSLELQQKSENIFTYRHPKSKLPGIIRLQPINQILYHRLKSWATKPETGLSAEDKEKALKLAQQIITYSAPAKAAAKVYADLADMVREVTANHSSASTGNSLNDLSGFIANNLVPQTPKASGGKSSGISTQKGTPKTTSSINTNKVSLFSRDNNPQSSLLPNWSNPQDGKNDYKTATGQDPQNPNYQNLQRAQEIIDNVAVDSGNAPFEDFAQLYKAPTSATPNAVKLSEADLNSVLPDDKIATGLALDTPRSRLIFRSIRNLINQGKQPQKIWMYRIPRKGDDQNPQLQNGDWLTLNREFTQAVADANGVPRPKLIEVPLENVYWDGKSPNRFGYDAGQGLTRANPVSAQRSPNMPTAVTSATDFANTPDPYERYSTPQVQTTPQTPDSGSSLQVTSYNQIYGRKGAENLSPEDIGNLHVAMAMQQRGDTPSKIKRATGWEYDKRDNSWKLDKPDGELKPDKFKEAVRNGTGKDSPEAAPDNYANERVVAQVPLSEVWDDAELFKAYPDMANVPVRIIERDPTLTFDGNHRPAYKRGGQQVSERITIVLPKGVDANNIDNITKQQLDKATNVGVHEIQHGIQDREGFATGADDLTRDDKPRYIQGQAARDMIREALRESQKSYQNWKEGQSKVLPEPLKELVEEYTQRPTKERKAKVAEMEAKLDPASHDKWDKELKPAIDKMKAGIQELKEGTKGWPVVQVDPKGWWRLSAGEQEARLVENWRHIPYEKRRTILMASSKPPVALVKTSSTDSRGNYSTHPRNYTEVYDVDKRGGIIPIAQSRVTPETTMDSPEQPVNANSYNQIYGVKGMRNLDPKTNEKIKTAEAMEKAGRDPLLIKKATGFERDPADPDNWVHENADFNWNMKKQTVPNPDGTVREVDTPLSQKIARGLDRPNLKPKTRLGHMTLGEIVDDPDLFKAYPDMKNMPVYFYNTTIPSAPTAGACYMASTYPKRQPDRIEMALRYKNGTKKSLPDLKEDLTHEITHAIQHRERGESPGNYDEPLTITGEFAKEYWRKLKDMIRKYHPDLRRFYQQVNGFLARVGDPMYRTLGLLYAKDRDDPVIQQIDQKLTGDAKRKWEIVKNYIDQNVDDVKLADLKEAANKAADAIDEDAPLYLDAETVYYLEGDEANARNAEYRVNMPEKQRQNSLLADTVYRRNNILPKVFLRFTRDANGDIVPANFQIGTNNVMSEQELAAPTLINQTTLKGADPLPELEYGYDGRSYAPRHRDVADSDQKGDNPSDPFELLNERLNAARNNEVRANPANPSATSLDKAKVNAVVQQSPVPDKTKNSSSVSKSPSVPKSDPVEEAVMHPRSVEELEKELFDGDPNEKPEFVLVKQDDGSFVRVPINKSALNNTADDPDYSSDNKKVKGTSVFLKDKNGNIKTTLLGVYETGDASTVVHETGHEVMTVFQELERTGKLEGRLKKDWERMKKELGIDDIDFTQPLSQEDQDRVQDAQEKFATAVERYIWIGKAPTARLRDLCRKLSKMLRQIYPELEDIKWYDTAGNEHVFEPSDGFMDVIGRILDNGISTAEIERALAYQQPEQEQPATRAPPEQPATPAKPANAKTFETSPNKSDGDSFSLSSIDSYNQLSGKKRTEYENRLRNARGKDPNDPKYLTPEQQKAAIDEIGKLGDNLPPNLKNLQKTVEKAAIQWLVTGHIRLPQDAYKVIAAARLLDRYPQEHLTQIMDPNELINKYHNRERSNPSTLINPDTVPVLKNKRELPNGVTVYDIDESDPDKAMVECRKILDNHWNPQAHPWCLLGKDDYDLPPSLENMIHARDFWATNSVLPKQIAFKNGKLLSFMGTDDASNPVPTWWNDQDVPFYNSIPYRSDRKPDGREVCKGQLLDSGKVITLYDLPAGRDFKTEYYEDENNRKRRETKYFPQTNPKKDKKVAEIWEWSNDEDPLLLRHEVYDEPSELPKLDEEWYPNGRMKRRKEWILNDKGEHIATREQEWYDKDGSPLKSARVNYKIDQSYEEVHLNEKGEETYHQYRDGTIEAKEVGQEHGKLVHQQSRDGRIRKWYDDEDHTLAESRTPYKDGTYDHYKQDEQGRPTLQHQRDGTEDQWTYYEDEPGRVRLTHTDNQGRTTTLHYRNGKLVEKEDDKGQSIQYDPETGNKLSATLVRPNGDRVKLTFYPDVKDQIKTEHHSNGLHKEFYKNGNKAVEDVPVAGGRIHRTFYNNPQNQQATEDRPNGGHYEWYENGNMKLAVPPKSENPPLSKMLYYEDTPGAVKVGLKKDGSVLGYYRNGNQMQEVNPKTGLDVQFYEHKDGDVKHAKMPDGTEVWYHPSQPNQKKQEIARILTPDGIEIRRTADGKTIPPDHYSPTDLGVAPDNDTPSINVGIGRPTKPAPSPLSSSSVKEAPNSASSADDDDDLTTTSYNQLGKNQKKDYAERLAKARGQNPSSPSYLSPEQQAESLAALEKLGEEAEASRPNDPKFKRKVEDAGMHWLLKGHIRLPEDGYKIMAAVQVAQETKGLDYKTFNDPNTLLNQYMYENKNAMATQLDTIPEFTDKTDYGYGVTVYDVEDSKEGQQAVRDMIDTYWGKKANPWCLAARVDGSLDKAWGFWNKTYTKIPKRIAFVNGQLAGFCANNSEETAWWNKLDENLGELIPMPVSYLKDGTEVHTGINKDTGQVLKVAEIRKDKNGNVLRERRYFLNENNRLASDEDKEHGTEVKYEDTPAHRVISERNPDGSGRTYFSDEHYRVQSETDSEGNTTEYFNDEHHRVAEELDTNTWYHTTYFNDEHHRVAEESKDRVVTTYFNDEHHRVAEELDMDTWGRTKYFNDEHHRVAEESKDHVVTMYFNDEHHRVAEERPEYSIRSKYYANTEAHEELSYDNLSRLVYDPANPSTKYFADQDRRIAEETDSEGNTTQYFNDEHHRVAEEKDSEGNTTRYFNDEHHRVAEDRIGYRRPTKYFNDEHHRVAEDYKDGVINTYFNDEHHRVAEEKDLRDNTTRYFNDEQHRVAEVQTPVPYDVHTGLIRQGAHYDDPRLRNATTYFNDDNHNVKSKKEARFATKEEMQRYQLQPDERGSAPVLYIEETRYPNGNPASRKITATSDPSKVLVQQTFFEDVKGAVRAETLPNGLQRTRFRNGNVERIRTPEGWDVQYYPHKNKLPRHAKAPDGTEMWYYSNGNKMAMRNAKGQIRRWYLNGQKIPAKKDSGATDDLTATSYNQTANPSSKQFKLVQKADGTLDMVERGKPLEAGAKYADNNTYSEVKREDGTTAYVPQNQIKQEPPAPELNSKSQQYNATPEQVDSIREAHAMIAENFSPKIQQLASMYATSGEKAVQKELQNLPEEDQDAWDFLKTGLDNVYQGIPQKYRGDVYAQAMALQQQLGEDASHPDVFSFIDEYGQWNPDSAQKLLEAGEGTEESAMLLEQLFNTLVEQQPSVMSTEQRRELRELINKKLQPIKDKYINTDQWMKAPNGQPTNLTELQWLYARTPEFKAKFGDWENDPNGANTTKAVDENGEPIVGWHGSRSQEPFDRFRSEESRGAIFTSDAPWVALTYANKDSVNALVPVFMDIKNPIVIDAQNSDWGNIIATPVGIVLDKNGRPTFYLTDADGNPFKSDQEVEKYLTEKLGISAEEISKPVQLGKFYTDPAKWTLPEVWSDEAQDFVEADRSAYIGIPVVSTDNLYEYMQKGFLGGKLGETVHDGIIIKNVEDSLVGVGLWPNGEVRYATDYLLTDTNQAKSAIRNTGEFSNPASDDDLTPTLYNQTSKQRTEYHYVKMPDGTMRFVKAGTALPEGTSKADDYNYVRVKQADGKFAYVRSDLVKKAQEQSQNQKPAPTPSKSSDVQSKQQSSVTVRGIPKSEIEAKRGKATHASSPASAKDIVAAYKKVGIDITPTEAVQLVEDIRSFSTDSFRPMRNAYKKYKAGGKLDDREKMLVQRVERILEYTRVAPKYADPNVRGLYRGLESFGPGTAGKHTSEVMKLKVGDTYDLPYATSFTTLSSVAIDRYAGMDGPVLVIPTSELEDAVSIENLSAYGNNEAEVLVSDPHFVVDRVMDYEGHKLIRLKRIRD